MFLFFMFLVCIPISGKELGGFSLGWKAYINESDGTISRYEFLSENGWEVVPFREDSMSGLAWEGISLFPVPERDLMFMAEKDNIHYSISYLPEKDHLVAICSLTNKGYGDFEPKRARLIIGVDSEMKTYPQWDAKFFPTLIRCEKNSTWGYFMSPRQKILAFGSEEPVASYGMNYIYEGSLEWKWGHQIKTASLDLLHCLPLPERHPQNMNKLAPGESRVWRIHLGGVENLSDVKNKLSHWLNVPTIECDRYTVAKNDSVYVNIYNKDRDVVLHISGPSKERVLSYNVVSKSKKDIVCRAVFLPKEEGLYTIKAISGNGKTAEAKVYVRKPWSWYMRKAKDFVSKNPPLFSNACETFYGYYTAFLGAKYFPDNGESKILEERFNRTLPLIIDTVTWVPNLESLPHRIQNFSALMGMLVDLWETTGNSSYLEKASHIGDFLCSDKIQWQDGSYRSRGVHYTAVIYTAKSMMELAMAEKMLIDCPVWNERFERHFTSAAKAVDDLLKRRDDIETEGDMTFEDGMISCSALQLGMFGQMQQNKSLRDMYASAARYLMDKHQCLEQLLIPDARMRGGTLRYWEALDVYFVPNQIMNSPHGWTAWKIYASYYLYLLTGEEYYLTDFMDTLGACIQVMDLDGKLRWGFVPDPYVEAKVYVENMDKPFCGMPVDSIVGEQYLDMISPWLRPDDEENTICQFKERGGAGDNTVQEIFKALEECALTSAYILVRDDGSVKAYNCRAVLGSGGLLVIPDEPIIEKIHLNAKIPVTIEVQLQKKKIIKESLQGQRWIKLKV